MIVPDTSAWVELLRDTGHAVAHALEALIDGGHDVAITDCVYMELLAGARNPRDYDQLRASLLAYPLLRLETLADFEEAAVIYRSCRAGGDTIRSMVDCLIAAVAIRVDGELLHNDSDFEAIARHSDLRLYR